MRIVLKIMSIGLLLLSMLMLAMHHTDHMLSEKGLWAAFGILLAGFVGYYVSEEHRKS